MTDAYYTRASGAELVSTPVRRMLIVGHQWAACTMNKRNVHPFTPPRQRLYVEGMQDHEYPSLLVSSNARHECSHDPTSTLPLLSCGVTIEQCICAAFPNPDPFECEVSYKWFFIYTNIESVRLDVNTQPFSLGKSRHVRSQGVKYELAGKVIQ